MQNNQAKSAASSQDSFAARKRARRKRRAKKLLRRLPALASALLVLAALVSFAAPVLPGADGGGEAQQATSLTTAEAVIAAIDKPVHGSGSVQPKAQPGVYAKTDGTVEKTLVSMGDVVKAGDVLVTLQNPDLEDEIAQLEYDLTLAQDAVEAVETYSQIIEREVRYANGRVMVDSEGEEVTRTVSNELMIRSPCDARVMAIYIEPGDDALAAYREYGSVMILSTDGRMKVELEGVESGLLSIGQTVQVMGEGIDATGEVVSLARRGTQAVVEVKRDDFPMDSPVSVAALDGTAVGEGILAVNKPLAISAYGGTIRSVEVRVGQLVEREDRLARFYVREMPLYIDNASVLRDYAVALTSLEAAQKKRDALKILAPCDATVVSVEAGAGDSVADGDLLVSLVADEGMEIILAVDELDIPYVAKGQTVTLSVDALEGLELTGTVEKIAPLGNTETSVTTYDVYVRVENVDDRVLGGMNVSGEIVVDAAQDAVLVPTDSLRKNDAGYYVTMEDGSARQVATGIMTDEYTQILGGVDAGESVVY